MTTSFKNVALEAKEAVRGAIPSSAWRSLKRLGRRRTRTLNSFEELEAFLTEAQQRFLASDAAGHQFVAGVELSHALWTMPENPESIDYRNAQLEAYSRLSGRTEYRVNHEFSELNLEHAAQQPFPYATGSAITVGEQLMAMGFVIRALNPAPNARIAEFGPGWAHTTEQLLRLGCRVTTVEVDPQFCELIRTRLGHFAELSVEQGDMLQFESRETFDAILFFESFHHCANPHLMLQKLRLMLRPGGVVAFGAEPIADFPWPWGVRLDGLSLYSMRRYGWLELGFESRYFTQLLQREGFTVERRKAASASSLCDVVLATKV